MLDLEEFGLAAEGLEGHLGGAGAWCGGLGGGLDCSHAGARFGGEGAEKWEAQHGAASADNKTDGQTEQEFKHVEPPMHVTGYLSSDGRAGFIWILLACDWLLF
jgi:hypothetical protein